MGAAAAGGAGDDSSIDISTPLLHQDQQQQDAAVGGSGQFDHPQAAEREGNGTSDSLSWNWADTGVEAKTQLAMAAPMIGVNVFQSTLTIVSVMFVGHLDELSLASSSIATSFATVTGYSVMVGLATALETLCGQAQGAKQYRMLGVFLQRGVIVQLLASLLVTLLWLNTARLLRLLGQDPEISDKAGEYAVWLIPYVYGHAILQPIQRFLQAQAVVLPMLWCSVATMAGHVLLCWLLVYRLNVGFEGAALAASISVWLNVAYSVLYIKFSSTCRKTWSGFSIGEAWQDMAAYFYLAIPSTVMVCLEWWCFEFLVLLSGLLPNPQLELSALSICMNTVFVAYMIPFGLSAAVSTRISNELGAGRPQAARFAVFVTLIMASITALTVSITLFSLRHIWGGLFSNEKEVIAYAASMIPFLSIITIMDEINGVFSGVARGCGWQDWGAWVNLGAYYIVGLPAAALLAFHFHLNGRGLWMGMLGALATQLACLAVITLLLTDWNKQVENAKIRVASSAAATLPVSIEHTHS